MKSSILEELEKIFKVFARYNRNGKVITEETDNLIVSSDLVISKLVKDWLTTQQAVDQTMGGLRVYSDLKTNKGKKVNYGLCITSELAELLDSIPWKHWKDIDSKVDLNNYATELIDLMHFLPAAINVVAVVLENSGVREKIALDIYAKAKTVAMSDDTTTFSSEMIYYINNSLDVFNNNDIDDVYELTSKYQAIMSAYNSDIISFFMRVHNIKALEGIKLEEYVLSSDCLIIDDALRALYFMYTGVVLTIELYTKVFNVTTEEALDSMWYEYLVKNVLNIFRVNNGYKEKTYIKEWNGEEDNIVVKRIADSMFVTGDVDKDTLYTAVDKYYKNNVVKIKTLV